METENLSDKISDSPVGFINPAFNEVPSKDLKSEDVDDENAEAREGIDDETQKDTEAKTADQTKIDKNLKETENNEIKSKEENGRKRAKSEDKSITGDVSLSSVDIEDNENGKMYNVKRRTIRINVTQKFILL